MTILQLLKEVNEDLQSSKNYGMVLIPVAAQKLQKAIELIESEAITLEQIKQAFTAYRKAEGCSCCRNIEAHKEAENRLAELLNPAPYSDGSGFDW